MAVEVNSLNAPYHFEQPWSEANQNPGCNFNLQLKHQHSIY